MKDSMRAKFGFTSGSLEDKIGPYAFEYPMK
jgi:hypothetical protein